MARSFTTLGRRGLMTGLAASAAHPAFATNSAAANNAPDGIAHPAILPTPATPNGRPWDRAAFIAAMAASGRPAAITEAQFNAIQSGKPGAMQAIATALTHYLGHADPLTLAAFAAVPRAYFLYNYQTQAAGWADAYAQPAKPYPLGYGSSLTDYVTQAYMTQLLAPRPGDVSLEIGTGSGFQSALLSRIVSHAYTIEITPPLGQMVRKIFAPLGYTNVSTRTGDGYSGWPEAQKTGFDIIILTCAAPYVPPALLQQLKPGGRLIAPLGLHGTTRQNLYFYHKDATGMIHARRDRRCTFPPMTGIIERQPRPPAATG